MSTFQETISNFIGNNLKKVSADNKPPVTKIIESSIKDSVNYAETSIKDSVNYAKSVYDSPVKDSKSGNILKTLCIILVIVILSILLWQNAKKYYPEWKRQFQDFLSNKVYREIKEPQPIQYEKTHTKIEKEDPMFDQSNNLNSNEILDYLLTKKEDGNTEKNEWCFYGKSRGQRYCTISEGNKCMSGDMFPSKDLCVNPKLKKV